ncbi:hypothetical protein IFM89_003306 [Coptis chinensis]|uniref:Uncharacterized protein n=1 Tax=Coptis chinensis TaxID=261450 RepID=A0A835MH38_9MAGN|nr:hypothetical protein IFM89_003306 [Coptis chinensis]
MIFAFIVTNHGAGKAISGRGFKEYRLGDYSNWLQNHVVNGKHWGKFRSCLIASKLCMRLGDNAGKASEFNMKDLSPIELTLGQVVRQKLCEERKSGCCMPPTYCGFTFKNATFWEVPKSGPAAPDLDCLTWSNHQETLCYDSKSCKAGILDNFIALVRAPTRPFLSLVHCIGSCAYKGNRDERYKRYRGYP